MDVRQLQLAKYMYATAIDFCRREDPMACGLAISLAQDAVELLIWTVAKERDAHVNDKDPFTLLIDKVEKKTSIHFPFKAKMLELNAARVKFKHFGNLPLPDDATRLIQYADECLRESMKAYLAIDIDSLSLADMISNSSIRERIKEAEKHLQEGARMQCLAQCAEVDFLIFQPLDRLIPKVDEFGLREVRHILSGPQSSTIDSTIRYVAKYMESLRSIALASLVNLRGRDYFRYKGLIPVAYKLMSGEIKVDHKRSTYTKEEALFCLKYVTEVGLRIQQWMSSV